MKLALAEKSRSYELTYLVPASLTEAELSKVIDEVEALVKKHKLSVTSSEKWGKKKLAYKIKHAGSYQNEANYVHVLLNGNPLKAQDFERDIFLNTTIFRHLLVVVESPKAEKTAAKPASKKAEVETKVESEEQL